MINKKKRTMLLMLSTLLLVGGAIVFALSRSEDDKAKQGQVEQRDNNDGSASANPVNPNEDWARAAKQDGIEKVRPLFKRELEYELNQFEHVSRYPFKPGILGSPTAHLSMGIMFCGKYWALSEAYAIHNGNPVPKDFDKTVWKPLVNAMKKARAEYTRALKKIEGDKEKWVTTLNTKTGKKEIDTIKLKKYEKSLAEVRENSDQSYLFLYLARLAKVAKRPDLVEEVFDAYDDEMITRNDYENKSREKVVFASAKEFLAFDHKEIFKELYGKRIEPIRKPSPPPLPENVITEKEKTAIRKFHREFIKALIAKDRKKLISFCFNPSKEVIAKIDKSLKKSTLHDADLSGIKYQFSRKKSAGPISVRSSHFKAEKTKRGKRQEVTSIFNEQIMFVDGTPKSRRAGSRLPSSLSNE